MQVLPGHNKKAVFALTFSPDGTLLASAGHDGDVRLWDLRSGAEHAVLSASRYMPPCLGFSPDGRWLAGPSSTAGMGPWVWDMTRPDRRENLILSRWGGEAQQWAQAVGFSPDGGHVVLVGQRGMARDQWRWGRMEAIVRRWQVGSWEELPAADFDIPADRAWRQPWVLNLRANLLVTPDYRGSVFWDLREGKELYRVDDRSHKGDPGALAFSPDGSRFAVARTRSILVYDTVGRRVVATWKNPTPKYVLSQAFSPDGRTLASVSNDSAARLWDADTGREKAAYAWDVGPLKSVAFAPDGMRAAAGGQKGQIVVWDVD